MNKLFRKIKSLFIKKEEKVKMIIELSDSTTTDNLTKIIGWLQAEGHKPVVKGQGNGTVCVKIDPEEKFVEELEETKTTEEDKI